MKIDVAPGRYVLAVSGGVDSMTLLDLLAHMPQVEIVVAHFDHGIRPDSAQDRELVQKAAEQYGLEYIYEEGQLGSAASENVARKARYDFLRRAQGSTGATAIVTAHHQDDVIETIMLNLMRGTNRRGLSSLRSTEEIIRPLLGYTKNELQQYAVERGITWREDSTNADMRYKRNYIRQQLVPRLSPADRQELLRIATGMRAINDELDSVLVQTFQAISDKNGHLVRKKFIMLPYAVSIEVLAMYLRRSDVRNLSKRTLSRLVVALKTARPHTTYDVDVNLILVISTSTAYLTQRPSHKKS